MNKKLLTIVIVNWNAAHQLKDSLASVARYHHDLVAKVIIVDNASTDDSLEQVQSLQNLQFQVQIIRNTINQGFGKACNQGAMIAASDYLLFLNPDAALYKSTLPSAMVFMQDPTNVHVGICGVQLIDESGYVARHCVRFPTVKGFVAHGVGLDRIFPRFGHVMSEWDHTTTRQVDQVIGAFFLVRRSLFDLLGGFDERFFVYYEEVDFSYRAYCAGWKSAYFSGAKAFHAGNGTTKHIKSRRLFYSLRSRLLYVFKHFIWYKAITVFLALILIEPISRSVISLVRRSLTGLMETWLAYGMLFRWLPRWVLRGKTR